MFRSAVYTFGRYFDLGCWRDRDGMARTMTLLKRRPRRIDWVNLKDNVENIGLHHFLYFIFSS